MKSHLDTNAKVAALLRDLAAVQTSQQSKWGYKRAAAAILDLDKPLESLLQPDGTLPKIPDVGPSSLRVVNEFRGVPRAGAAEGKKITSEVVRVGFGLQRFELILNFQTRKLRWNLGEVVQMYHLLLAIFVFLCPTETLGQIATIQTTRPSSAANGTLTALEDQAIAKLCAFKANVAEAAAVSSFEFKRADAFPCLDQLLANMNRLQLDKAGRTKLGQKLIWNLATTILNEGSTSAVVSSQIVPLLRGIAKSGNNPERAQARLALTLVDKVDFKKGRESLDQLSNLVSELLPFSREEMEQMAARENRSITAIGLLTENAHPLFVERLEWYAARSMLAAVNPSLTAAGWGMPNGLAGTVCLQGLRRTA
jgi:hypothetical protein